jgi:hypothetical protein
MAHVLLGLVCEKTVWFMGRRVGHVLGYTTLAVVTQLRLCLRYMLGITESSSAKG